MHLARRLVVVLLLGLCLGASAATAGENRTPASLGGERAASRSPLGVLERLQGLLTSVWGSTGCWIDPWGRCLAEQTAVEPTPPGASPDDAVESDVGAWIDPWGVPAH